MNFCTLSIVGLSFIAFVIDGNIKTYGLLYLELLDKYDEGAQRTGMAGTVFGVAGLTLGMVLIWLLLHVTLIASKTVILATANTMYLPRVI